MVHLSQVKSHANNQIAVAIAIGIAIERPSAHPPDTRYWMLDSRSTSTSLDKAVLESVLLKHRASSIEHRVSSSPLLPERERVDCSPVDQVLLLETRLRQIGKRLFSVDGCEARGCAENLPNNGRIVVVVGLDQ